jgi:hypothetical protein
MQAFERELTSTAEVTGTSADASEATGGPAEVVELSRDLHRTERAFGFFDTATIGGRGLRVMGVVQEMFYDRQKKANPEEIARDLREFVLGFFMRVSHWQSGPPAGDSRPLPLMLKPLSWIPEPSDGRLGFGFEQLVGHRHTPEQIVKFAPRERGAIVDLRHVGSVYDWVAMRVNLFDFKLTIAPFGPNAPKLDVPMKEVTYLLVTPDLVVDRQHPAPGVVGEYGFGYGLLPYTPEHTIFAYGPGKFAAGFQSFRFRVLETGEVRVKAVFVVNRPDKILNVDVDPIDWGFRLADKMTFNVAAAATGPLRALAKKLPLRVANIDPVSLYISTANRVTRGLAGRQLGISIAQLEKHMLQRHFLQHRQMLLTSQLAWRTVPDWTDHRALPEFCHRGLTTD